MLSSPGATGGTPLLEVADRVRVASYAGCNTTVVAGAAGLLVVDPAPEPSLVADLQALEAPVVAVVVTHAHEPHTGGVAALREAWPSLVLHAQEDAGVAADRSFSSVGFVDLADRVVELLHPGRAHSAGDVVVRVPDADVVVVGDLADGDGAPRYGEECYPVEWPATFDVVVGLLTPRTVVVPGHGPLLDKERAEDQRGDVAVVAQMIADAAAPSVTVDGILAAQPWPFPAEHLRLAVARGLEQLPRTARQLPLL